MKKRLFIIILMLVFVLTGCSSSKLKSLSYEELTKKLNDKETFIVYFSTEENNSLEKKLSNVLEDNGLEGYRVNINKITAEEKNTLQLAIPYEDPSIVFIIEGRDPSKLSHITDEEILTKHLIEKLKDMNFIK